MADMDERKLTKQLFRILAITVIGSLLLSALALGIVGYMMKSAHGMEHTQIQAEAAEYRVRLLKQMDKNLQILTTLSKAYEVSTITNEPERLQQNLTAINSANDFISVVYMRKDGTGIMHTSGDSFWSDITLQDCHPESVEAIESALQGESAVSKMFDSEVYGGKLFVYAIPVYHEGELVGVLAASDTLDIFTDIANGNSVMGGAGYVHLINDKGDILVRSENTLVQEEVQNIYDGTILTKETKEKTRAALQAGEPALGEYTYNGEKCHFYLEPLEINGWYLFCANRVWGTTLFSKNIMVVFGIVALLLVVLVNVLLYSGYYVFRKNTKSLIRIAYHDPLTGAENTVRFDQNYRQVLYEHKPHSTVALNVHNFKSINDLFGKGRGDTVLCYLKDMVEGMMQEGEFFCRDTADLFYLLLMDTDGAHITQRLQALIDHISKAALCDSEYSYDLSLYAGVAVEGDREKALIAMQSIEHIRHIDIAFYNQPMHDAVRRRNSTESQMYPALQNQEFKLFLQPKFDMKTGKLVGAEALVRWQNSNGTYRLPGEFVPLFEENGFCIKLDLYMIEQACIQLRTWIDKGITPIPISVNQSKLLFSDLNYPDNLMQILNRYEIPAELITLEILEGIETDNLELLNHQIDALHERGFRVSMDDFGSGYSSLNMLYQLKIDELKLDRGFLRKASKEDQERRRIILEQIIQFAQRLNIVTVAEGIETQADKTLVQTLNCNFGQGYFYDKPLAAQDFSQKYME